MKPVYCILPTAVIFSWGWTKYRASLFTHVDSTIRPHPRLDTVKSTSVPHVSVSPHGRSSREKRPSQMYIEMERNHREIAVFFSSVHPREEFASKFWCFHGRKEATVLTCSYPPGWWTAQDYLIGGICRSLKRQAAQVGISQGFGEWLISENLGPVRWPFIHMDSWGQCCSAALWLGQLKENAQIASTMLHPHPRAI